ncbi:MAG: hypothetical protein V1787_01665, partial [Candidatus Micrarchaeota archaeon]
DWYINQSTTITLTCTDPEPHPADHTTIHYRYAINDGEFTEWTAYEQPFTYPEDSRHTLEYYCTDALGNTEQTQMEVDVVDSQPPETMKEVGEPKYACQPDEQCDWYITQQTPINLTCIDPEPHPVDHATIYYRYSINGDDPTEWMQYAEPFTYPEDSRHTLEYYCTDLLGNEEQHQFETDVVDTQAPELEKFIGDPKVSCDEVGTPGCDYYITQSTPITLNCVDGEPHPVDHVTISYRSRYKTDFDDEYGDWTEWTNIDNETTEFTFNEDSIHELEYQCVDALGNTAGPLTETDIVDSEGPTVEKTVGDPKVSCDEVGTPDCDYYITQSTPISFLATDPEPHPVDHANIYYRYNINGGNWTEWQLYEGAIYFGEDSRHTIEYKAVDALGNEGPLDSEVDIVDSQAPNTAKEVGEPKHACQPDEECDWYINQSTTITLTCTDPEPHPVDHTAIYYRYAINDGEFTEWTAYEQPFTYPEDSRHTLEYYCTDLLGNEEQTQTETDIVDSQPPEVTKSVGEPSIPCEDLNRTDCHYFITQATDITLGCTDPEPHPVNHVTMNYRYRLDGGDWTEWIQNNGEETVINFGEDSVHEIEYYCADALGNTLETQTEVDRVDTTPPFTQKDIWGNHTACLPGVPCDYYVCRDTSIGFTATDGGPICHVDGVTTYYRYRINGGEWSDWMEYGETGDFVFDDNPEGVYEFEYYSTDLLGNTEETRNETDYFDKQPPLAWMRNPSSGNEYHDGEAFNVLALADDSGNPASGFDSCDFYAIDIHDEDLLPGELVQLMELMGQHDIQALLDFLGPSRYTLVSLGQVPHQGIECKGAVMIPENSGLTDKAYLVIKIADRSCNIYYDIARDIDGNTILMEIDNTPPIMNITETQGLGEPTTTGRYFAAFLEAYDPGSGLRECFGKILHEGNDIYITGVNYTDNGCLVFGTVPVPEELEDGSHTIWFYARDYENNLGNDTRTIIIDNTPPEKEVTSPVVNETYGEIVPIEVTAADASGVNPSTVQYRVFENLASLFGVPLGEGEYDSYWRILPLVSGDVLNGTYGIDFNATQEGLQDGKTYYLRARACDVLFEGTLPDGAEIPPHCTDPEVTFKMDLGGPTAPAGVTISDGVITWGASSDPSGVDHYNIYKDGELAGTSDSTTYNTGGAAGEWSVSAVDRLGNEGARAIATVPTGGVTTPPSSGGGGSYSGGFQSDNTPPQPAKEPEEVVVETQAPEVEAGVEWEPLQQETTETPAVSSQPSDSGADTAGTEANTRTGSDMTGLVSGAMFPWQYGAIFVGLAVIGFVLFTTRRDRQKVAAAKARKSRAR